MSGEVAKQSTPALMLAAIGVVYGDIGTSPLYTLQTTFRPVTGIPVDEPHIIGVVSCVLWTIMAIVTVKYVLMIMRASNRGEGGIMALLALVMRLAGDTAVKRTAFFFLGACGAALFYGDSVITPAISVLSAVEGLEVATPALQPYVLPIAVGVLVGLFVVQRRGTGAMGKVFGPLIVLWFVMLGGVGLYHLFDAPQILMALDPRHAAWFIADRGPMLLVAVAAIVLAVTGAEALYENLGHFGARPIRLAWIGFVMPALTLNYLGQGALLISHPEAHDNPFYRMFPPALLLPAIALAAMATVIASQAVLSGAASMTRQMIQLGYLPRMRIVQTSSMAKGQIYMPLVNWLLLVAVLLATLGFGTSANLASAYGFSVTLTMLITTVLAIIVVRSGTRVPWPVLVILGALFLALDTLLVLACSLKLIDGGWFSLLLASALVLVMSTWRTGHALAVEGNKPLELPLLPFISSLANEPFTRVPRTAVFMVSRSESVPHALLHNLKHNMVLHERNILAHVEFTDDPTVALEQRVTVEPLVPGFWRVTILFGFMERPDVPGALNQCAAHGLEVDLFTTSFFIDRQTVIPTRGQGMSRPREELFSMMYRNAGSVISYFNIPNNSVIELGRRVNI